MQTTHKAHVVHPTPTPTTAQHAAQVAGEMTALLFVIAVPVILLLLAGRLWRFLGGRRTVVVVQKGRRA